MNAELRTILERSFIHVTASAMLVMAVFFFIRFCDARWPSLWLPDELEARLLISGLTVFGASTLREPFDVWKGQTINKTCADFASWLTGCAFSVWLLYRFKYLI